MPMPAAIAFDNRHVHLAARLFSRAESSIRQDCLHVFAGLARDGDLEIVNRCRAVHHEAGYPAAPHQVQQHVAQAALDDVPAHAPQDRARFRPGPLQRVQHAAKRLSGEDLGEAFDQLGDAAAFLERPCELAHLQLAAALRDRDRLQSLERKRLFRVLTHADARVLCASILRSAWAV